MSTPLIVFLVVVAIAIHLAPVMHWRGKGPNSYLARYGAAVRARLTAPHDVPPLTEEDLSPLPGPVQRYIRLSGGVGQPRVENFRARFHGRIRSGPTAPWMPFTGEQHNFYDPPARLFLMDATMFGIPFQAFHRFVDGTATMQVRVATLKTVVDAKGAVMDESETVTLFNDLVIMAPGALVSPQIAWEAVDDTTVRAAFTNGAWTIHATLTFNSEGELVDFSSDDRAASSPDGCEFTRMRWSTPVRSYREFGAHRLAGYGEGHWHASAREFAYLEFELDQVDYNVSREL
jgi:hypothetical protein